MITYKLFKYGLALDDEEMVFENEDQEAVVERALELSNSAENKEFADEHGVGYWTYRLEKCVDGERSGGWRFFNYDGEFTGMIIEAALNNVNSH